MAKSQSRTVNNAFYEEPGLDWHEGSAHPIALLRAEARFKNPWVARAIKNNLGADSHRILDIGCGGGYLAIHLARLSHRVTGLDSSPSALAAGAHADETRSVDFVTGSGFDLPWPDSTFDVTCAMDLLEHVDSPKRIIAEASRVLRPGGLFFFHTFNRTPLAWLFAIKGLEWFVKNTPERLHVLSYFVRPRELEAMCREHHLSIAESTGIRPKFNRAFLELLRQREVPDNFEFIETGLTSVGYLGFAKRLE
ncbi:MAG TPA: bifunctional 2-polyprenyl-6-hydroxyphenol methylase/3-demethylubiquinol 3-O-methyltransferase UbiG [Bdellovibrionota bacterium]|nr:bifunctional 2-polyprenyl-6-hydroxyphenol methylase/3-demethylubiquinol 3-O-methyltransferase UbiG [Bdellovibrionota bacterium]